MSNWLYDVTLEEGHIKLLPLEAKHRGSLLEAASDGELWKLWFTSVPSEDTMEAYIERALADKAQQKALPFVVFDSRSKKIIGCTRFCNVDSPNKRLEIGYTWYAKSHQKTGTNTLCKLMLLRQAFETLGAIAVEFRTHWFNQASRNAIARLGAKQDGVLRNHRMDADGTYRDTVVFSIIESEWPAVKKSLLNKIQHYK